MSGADVVVVGGGIVGLAAALALAERDAEVLLIDEPRPGAASRAAAGLLAPSIGAAAGPVRSFGIAARDRWPTWVEMLRERAGIAVPLDRGGILDVAADDDGVERLRAAAGPTSEWIDRTALARLEPALDRAAGALLHHLDGAVDVGVLMDALERVVASTPRIRRERGAVVRIEAGGGRPSVHTSDGGALEGGRVVLAAGAWAPLVEGLPRRLPVEPVRGQMLLLEGAPLLHVVHGPDGYLVPRGGTTLAGSTEEHAGFDPSTTAGGIAALAQGATRLCPALVGAPPLAEWAGLRPMTPDRLPIVGVEPLAPALVYACGHSRNGILAAPLTAECVASLVCDETPPVDVAPFAPERFDG